MTTHSIDDMAADIATIRGLAELLIGKLAPPTPLEAEKD